MKAPSANDDLYLVVIPAIHLNDQNPGYTEQILTLLPGEYLATPFFPDEVGRYIIMFKNRTKYLTGGHVTGYDLVEETRDDGRVIVRVIQNVR
jgi:hypothetical protein